MSPRAVAKITWALIRIRTGKYAMIERETKRSWQHCVLGSTGEESAQGAVRRTNRFIPSGAQK